ncbi:flagellar motor switch protein FliM [Jeotgalibacillus proteolyticus]|uniref:Flagellar motor switch protein FliM n=1 Tax=Jeotgalibacillus proteolyticus TaxID=2082395 RepID=A0A2S5GGL0_9BACL|nr:flagellar motor switch protein FliM [Jeotgalibacillus proteolyticus]PPA72051.1 flagellar motor switch protein FliM [Jeotgalibacillus proteolyticus]
MAGDILTQNEIDALLSAISTGEMSAEEIKKDEQEKKIKVYDFKRALRFSKDQIRSLTRIHENFARLLTTFFSAQLRTFVQINVATVDQIPYEEFIRSVPKMTILNVYEVSSLNGKVLMEINPNVAYAMMDRVMGGRGSSLSKIENLTEIETKVMSRLFEKGFENLREAWGTIADIDPVLIDFEVNPKFLQVISPNETVVVISLNTVVGETSGMINICLPHVLLEPIMPSLSVKYWMQTNKSEGNTEDRIQLKKQVKTADLPVSASIGSSMIAIEEFLKLEIGDVLELNHRYDHPVTIKIGDVPKFTGQPGILGNRLAVQIIGETKGGEEDDEG